jgi:ADP-ribose pyrophosphatase
MSEGPVEATMSASSPRNWETLSRRKVVDCHPWLRLWAEDVQLPDGRVVEGFFTIEMPDYVVDVALTPDGRVVVERNYKHGPRRVCLNLPAGYVEPGEEPLAAARRELLEETGYVAQEWLALGGFTNDGNRGCGMGHLFLAHQAQKVADPDAGDLEEMEIGLMGLDEVIEAVRRGDVAVLSMAAAIGLAMVAQNTGRGPLTGTLE